MKGYKLFFHYLSYAQYPFMMVGLFYCYRPLFNGLELLFNDFNNGLVFFGLALSLSTLQDTRKTQNKISKRVFENTRYTKIFLVVLLIQILLYIAFGLAGMFTSAGNPLTELAYGLISIGVGLIGILKGGLEIAENLAKAKN